MTESRAGPHGRLILVPAGITLAVTLLRLIGELQEWSSALFNRSAGGGGAIVGIVWLVPVFGIYFALKLAYDQPDYPGMAPLVRWFWIGVLPQLGVWIAFTVVVGMLFGLLAVSIVHRSRASQTA